MLDYVIFWTIFVEIADIGVVLLWGFIIVGNCFLAFQKSDFSLLCLQQDLKLHHLEFIL